MQELEVVVESYNEYISNLPQGLMVIVSQLQNEEYSKALHHIKDFSEGIMWLTEAASLINTNNGYAAININEIAQFLVEVNEGLELQDYTLVADIFEYEVIPYTSQLEKASILV